MASRDLPPSPWRAAWLLLVAWVCEASVAPSLGWRQHPRQRYHPHFDTTPDHLGIAARAAGVGDNAGTLGDNYYLVIADHGGCDPTEGVGSDDACEQQRQVATLMRAFIQERRERNPHATLLFVLAVGDNFYPKGLGGAHRFKDTWLDVYGPDLVSVPWFAVLGNHDAGDSDAGFACPGASPRFVCNATNQFSRACGGPRPYSNASQSYSSNQINAEKGGVGGEMRKNWYLPDFTYFYTIPELDFELVALDWNAEDIPGLGGSATGAAKVVEVCGSLQALTTALQEIQDASTAILYERSLRAAHKNVALIGHYPPGYQRGYSFRDMYLGALPHAKREDTKVFNFHGHEHYQACLGHADGECVELQTGGGGGCCTAADVPAGFTAVRWDHGGRQVVDCFAPDPRCTMGAYQVGLARSAVV